MADMTSTDMILSAIVGLKDDISSMKLELSAVVGLKDDISSMKQEIRTLTRKVDQTRILSGSLVEANIRNYFTKEYGESFSRHYVATDLSGLIYLATPRELRKKSDGYNVLLKQRANFINGVFRSSASVNLFEYLCGIDSSPDYHPDLETMKSLLPIAQVLCPSNGKEKKNTTEVFESVIKAMLDCSKTDYTNQMKKLEKACADERTRSIVFALIISLVVKACETANPPLTLDPERIWNDKQLEFDLRGNCEVKPSDQGKIVRVQTGEVKSNLTRSSKSKAISQLIVRSLAVALTAAFCDPDISRIEADCMVVAFNKSTSINKYHTLLFNLGSIKKPKNVAATLRLTSIIPPNTTSLKDLDEKIETH